MKTNFIFGEPSYTIPVVEYNSTKETFDNVVDNIAKEELPSVSELLIRYYSLGGFVIGREYNSVSNSVLVEMLDGKCFYFFLDNHPNTIKDFLIKMSEYHEDKAYNDYSLYFGRQAFKEQFEQ